MIRQKELERLRLFIILRLFIATILLFLANYAFRFGTYIFYYLIIIVCGFSLLYLFWLIWGRFLRLFLWTQLVLDCAWQTILIYFTGDVDSMFAPIYILPIISSGILIAPWSSFVIAALSSIFFTGIVVMQFNAPVTLLENVVTDVHSARQSLYLFYATYVRVTIYFVVAILTNYLTGSILRLEERIKIQERLAFLGDITSTIAHEIRNPLAAISNSIEVLMISLKAKLSDRDNALMCAVIEESQRLKNVFQKILDYSKIDELKLEKVSLNKLIDHVLFLFENSKEFSQRVSVVRNYTKTQVSVDADSELMIDVLMNIVRNAYEAMERGGTLTVDFIEDQKHVTLRIKDTGSGIKKEIMKNLFLPFKTSKKTGTGLGLAQAHKVVSMHGGDINIKSEPNLGTLVAIRLKRKLYD